MQRAIGNGCSFLLRSVMVFLRGKETGTRIKAVRTFRSRKGSNHLRYGVDACPV